MSPSRAAVLLAAATALAGCGSMDDDGPSSPTEPTPVIRSDPDSHSPDLSRAMADRVAIAVADLSTRLDVTEDAITLVSADEVSWGDSSLGCPQPGMRYAQVVTDGTKIVLEHDGRTYDYHSGGERPDPFLCEQPPASKSPAPTPADDDVTPPR